MATNCMGPSGDSSRPRHQSLLSYQPSPLLRAFENQTYGVRLFHQGGPGVVCLLNLGIRGQFSRSLCRDDCRLYCFRSFRSETRAPLALLHDFCACTDVNDSPLETYCGILATVCRNIFCLRASALAP